MNAGAGLRTGGSGPQAGQHVAEWGARIEAADAAMILLHGRGSEAADILDLAAHLGAPAVAAVAPNARGGTWHPRRFNDPVSWNEPYLSSALSVVEALIAGFIARGLTGGRIILGGFSQGACLALEGAARHAGPVGGVIGFSGGLIGATLDPSTYPRHDGMPVFLGCSKRDPHISLNRVSETQALLRGLGAVVEMRLYADSDHGSNSDEIETARALVQSVTKSSR
jgi:phospholipase/carboxylesterase/glyoxalase family protein